MFYYHTFLNLNPQVEQAAVIIRCSRERVAKIVVKFVQVPLTKTAMQNWRLMDLLAVLNPRTLEWAISTTMDVIRPLCMRMMRTKQKMMISSNLVVDIIRSAVVDIDPINSRKISDGA